jgi:hypothetical protein
MKTHDNLQIIKPYLGSAEDDMMRVGKITFSPSHELSVHQPIPIKLIKSYLRGVGSDRTGPLQTGERRTSLPSCRCHLVFRCRSKVLTTYSHSFLRSLRPYLTHFKKSLRITFVSLEKLTMLSATRTRSFAPMGKVLRAVSTWSNVPAGPPDPILGMFRRSTPCSLYSIGLTD